jgi:hypothetical protein
MRDYREDTKINKHKLDEEWEIQSELAVYWGSKFINAKGHVKWLEYQLTKEKAKIAKTMRSARPGERITEGMLEQACFSDADYCALHEKFLQAENDMDMLEIASKAMYDRRASLQDLTDLFKTSYYSTVPNQVMQERTRLEIKYDAIEELQHNERLKRLADARRNT